MTPLLRLSSLSCVLAAQALPLQRPAAHLNPSQISSAQTRVVEAPLLLKASLLSPGKTQGTFHLTGLVQSDKKILLRWANTHGEMPTEGVEIYRQKATEITKGWKLVNDDEPVRFFQGKRVKKRLNAMSELEKKPLMSLFHSDLQHDPATKQRMVKQPAGSPKMKFADLTMDKVAEQYGTLRKTGRLAKGDLQLLHARADMDANAAVLLGLSYVDSPGKGQWRYKIVVKLPEGGTMEAGCAKTFDPSVPTPIPAAINLTAKGGNGTVLLNWEAPPSDVVTGYNIYRAESTTGPWKKLNTTPVKLVKLETEEPELAMRRAIGREAAIEKEMKRSAGTLLTPKKLQELNHLGREAASESAALPALSPALSASIREGVTSGRIKGGGAQTLLSLFTDDRRSRGNEDFLNEHTYHYRVVAVDIGGVEAEGADRAPMVAGMPKDLEPPHIPGRPLLKAEAEALEKLKAVHGVRMKDPARRDLDQAIAAKMPHVERALTPFLTATGEAIPSATKTPAPPPPHLALKPLTEIKEMRQSWGISTMPTQELAAVAKASMLYSNPDGSAPAANLVWATSADADLKSYEVYRATGKGSLQKVATTATPSWTDTSLEVGQAYRYAVTATDQRGNESEKSAVGQVEVCDSLLKQKLAIGNVSGKASTAVPSGFKVRSLIRPSDWVMKAGNRDAMKANASLVKLPKGGSGFPAGAYQVPKNQRLPKATLVKGMTGFNAASPALGISTKPVSASKLDLGKIKVLSGVKGITRIRPAAVNLMMVEPAHPKEIHVLLEWKRPTAAQPTEYLVYQAPQKTMIQSLVRPNLPSTEAFLGFGVKPSGAAMTQGTAPVITKIIPTSPTIVATFPKAAFSTKPTLPYTVSSTADANPFSVKGVAATSGSGLLVDKAKVNNLGNLTFMPGWGEFTRVNDTQVTTERYAITFPVDAGQYGGSTFFYRIQARALEFGHVVDGAMSEVIEVRLPDVVPPPAPAVGALDLQEAAAGGFHVGVTWSHVPAKDFVGCFVDRQAMNFTLVDGEPQPTTPLGEPKRLTPKAQVEDTFLDQEAQGGYQRYTIRSVDKTGNVSEPTGFMDVWIPGEPHPEAPSNLTIAGGRLSWKAVANAQGYSVWRSFTGQEDDYEQISGLLGASETGFNLPAQGTLHLKVVARSTTGMNQTASEAIVRTP